jgi:UDP-N-acetylglucosamine transferase subunit ALG13
MPDSERPFIFVTVGTDHHPFDRLIGWVDEWLHTEPGRSASCLVQSGTARPPRFAPYRPYLTQSEMLTGLGKATAVVSHGGPGTIMACRSLGLLPIVVPRKGSLGEHVDDHQVAFAQKMAARRDVWVADSEECFRALMNRVVEEPGAFRMAPEQGRTDATVTTFSELVESVLRARTRRHRRRGWSRGPS